MAKKESSRKSAPPLSEKKPATKKRLTKEFPRKASSVEKPPAKKLRAKKASARVDSRGGASAKIEKKIASLGDWRGETLALVRTLIHEADPDVLEEWKWMGTPVWSNNGMYVLANPHKDKVKMTFFHGAKLKDPAKLFNAGLGGNKWRAIDFREGDKIRHSALKALLREAVAYNAKNTVPKSRGSKA
jgi:hypothetical protein